MAAGYSPLAEPSREDARTQPGTKASSVDGEPCGLQGLAMVLRRIGTGDKPQADHFVAGPPRGAFVRGPPVRHVAPQALPVELLVLGSRYDHSDCKPAEHAAYGALVGRREVEQTPEQHVSRHHVLVGHCLGTCLGGAAAHALRAAGARGPCIPEGDRCGRRGRPVLKNRERLHFIGVVLEVTERGSALIGAGVRYFLLL